MSATALLDDSTKARAFFTLSIPMEGDDIDDLIQGRMPGTRGVDTPRVGRIWDQALLETIRDSIGDTALLRKAIDPMFEDIADRDRNLFVRDFLLDTPNEYDGSGPKPLRNVCRRVTLKLQRRVRWSTEGAKSRVELPAPVVFVDVLCRAFWMVHSNHALSYHLSFEFAFDKGLEAYYGLSMLLKAFNPSERTEWVLGKKGWLVQQPNRADERLLVFVENLFEEHMTHLFGQLALHSGGRVSPTVAKAVPEAAWQRLVVDPELKRSQRKKPASSWPSSERRRLLVILRDEKLFETAESARSKPELLRGLSPLSVGPGPCRPELLKAHFAAQVAAIQRKAKTDGPKPFDATELEQAVFMSGFFQNVVDFMQQDDLEVLDGISPLYPSNAEEAENNGYRVYATPRILFEMVGRSRSLDQAGRTWLGTCPYLFLVHVTAMQNEGIVRNYEDRVTALIVRLEALGISAAGFDLGANSRMQLREAFEEIKKFRLQTFEHVHKHLSFNVFRYETEKTFFRRLEELRGTASRRAYWDGVLQHLMETVDSLNEDSSTRHGLFLSTLGFFLAVTGVMQVLIALFQPDKGLAWTIIGMGLVACLVLIIPLNFYLKDQWNASTK